MNKRALLLMYLCVSTGNTIVGAMEASDNTVVAKSSLPKRSGGIEVMHLGSQDKSKQKGYEEAKQEHGGICRRAERGHVMVKDDQEQRVSLGISWWACSRLARIKYAFDHPEDPRSAKYLRSQNGRHELGRELNDACEGLVAKNLTIETPCLQTIDSIVTQGAAKNIIIHPDELQTAYIRLDGVMEQSKADINKLLAEKRRQFIEEISNLFYKEAGLVQHVVEIQAKIVRMSRKLTCEIPGAPEEVKIPTVAEIFAALCIGEAKHIQDRLGLTFTLEQQ